MSNEVKRTYLKQIRPRYREASRRQKGVILAEFCAVCGYSRKHAIRLLNGQAGLRQKPPGPRRRYGLELTGPLKRLWLAMGQPCSRRLKAGLPGWLPHYRRRHPELPDTDAALLVEMSPATLDRLLSPVRAKRGACATVPAAHWYRSVIPIQPKDWNVTRPGYLQGDTVAHCGEVLEGLFANTLTLTDIHTSWTENRATWGKASGPIIEALADIEKSLPFSLETIKFDSGSEFMNYGVINFLKQTATRPRPIHLVRSRPYKKDDNCYVEQKNYTHVRALVGYDRIDVRECVPILNALYRECWNPLANFFLPSIKLVRKTRIGARLKKEYDQPRTPYQRLLECADIPEGSKAGLRERYTSLDPFRLQEELQKRLKDLFQTLRRRTKKLGQAA